MKTNNQSKQHIWFAKLGEHIIKQRWVYLVLVLLITLITGIGVPKIKYDTSVENWFPKNSIIFANKQQYEDYFGNSDIIGIHLKTDYVFSEEIINMLDELGTELEAEIPFADNVTSIADMEFSFTIDDEIITEDLIPDEPQNEDVITGKKRVFSKEYLKNKIVSEDCTETWLVLNLLSYPDNYEKEHGIAPGNVVGKKLLEILSKENYQKYNLRAVGTPVYGYEELLFTGHESESLLGITIIVLLVFLFFFFRSFQGVVIPITTALVSIIIVFGTMGHLGIKINAFLFAVPIILSLAVSLGYSVHLFNYYERNLSESKNVRQALIKAIGMSGWPTAFAAFTTIGALLSFMAISLIPIRWLGLTSAVLILVIYLIVFVLTGSLLSFGKYKPKKKKNKSNLKSDKYFHRIGEFVFRNSKAVVSISILVVVLMGIGLISLEVNFDSERSYGMKVPYIKRILDVAKTKIGSFDSYNIALDFKEKDKVKDPEVLSKFDRFNDKVNELELTKKTNSVLTILKDMNRLINRDEASFYTIPESKNLVAQLLMFYEMSGGARLGDWINDDFSVLRLEVETNNMNASQTMKEMGTLQNLATELFPKATFTITGGMPKMAALNHMVAIGQIKSILLALIIIGILMMIVLGGVRIGLIGIIPNILPIIVVGGTMSFLGIPLDFVTVTIAPMILGISVDNTIHLINYLRANYKLTGNYKTSSVNAIVVIGRALFMTSFIIIISFVVYLTSPINMLVYLGIFVVVGIFTAFMTNLFITPLIVNAVKPFD